MTFLLYYDAGQAARVADQYQDKQYWNVLLEAEASEPKLKRGTERRHFRGANAMKALLKLQSFEMSPYGTLMNMRPADDTYTGLYNRMTNVYSGTQFGPYFIWKLYDIFNVCLDMPISLSLQEALKYMPDPPRSAATHFFPTFSDGLARVNCHIAQYDHPVVPGRYCGLAEAETVLCMMKGYFWTKTHTIGDDIEEKFAQLAGFPELQRLLPHMAGDWDFKRGELA